MALVPLHTLLSCTLHQAHILIATRRYKLYMTLRKKKKIKKIDLNCYVANTLDGEGRGNPLNELIFLCEPFGFVQTAIRTLCVRDIVRSSTSPPPNRVACTETITTEHNGKYFNSLGPSATSMGRLHQLSYRNLIEKNHAKLRRVIDRRAESVSVSVAGFRFF